MGGKIPKSKTGAGTKKKVRGCKQQNSRLSQQSSLSSSNNEGFEVRSVDQSNLLKKPVFSKSVSLKQIAATNSMLTSSATKSSPSRIESRVTRSRSLLAAEATQSSKIRFITNQNFEVAESVQTTGSTKDATVRGIHDRKSTSSEQCLASPAQSFSSYTDTEPQFASTIKSGSCSVVKVNDIRFTEEDKPVMQTPIPIAPVQKRSMFSEDVTDSVRETTVSAISHSVPASYWETSSMEKSMFLPKTPGRNDAASNNIYDFEQSGRRNSKNTKQDQIHTASSKLSVKTHLMPMGVDSIVKEHQKPCDTSQYPINSIEADFSLQVGCKSSELSKYIPNYQVPGTNKTVYSAVLNAYFACHGVVSQNINSFNKFLGTHLHDIITEDPIVSECYTTEPFPVRHEVHFTSITINRPKRDEGDGTKPMDITPNDCLNRSLTYSAEIFAHGYTLQFELINGVWSPVPFSAMEVEGRVKMPKNPSAPKPIPSYEKRFFVFLGKIPVMVRSQACHLSHYKSEEEFQRHRECYLDPGGYFIINGKERVLVAQEKLPENRAVVYECMKHNKFDTECEIRCSVEHSLKPVCVMWIRLMNDSKLQHFQKDEGNETTEEREEASKIQNQKTSNSSLKSSDENVAESSTDEELDDPDNKKCDFMKNIFKYAGGKQFVVVIPRLKEPIPLVLLFKALGFTNVDVITTFVLQGDFGIESKEFIKLLEFSLDLWDESMSQTKALQIIGSLLQGNKPDLTKAEFIDLGREVVNDCVLQNIGSTPEYDLDKGRFVCEMIRRVCEVHFGRRGYDDRDNLLNKRFELAGALFLQLFKRIWKQISFDVQRGIKRRLDYGTTYDIKAVINPMIITRGFNYSVSTGNWTDRKGSSTSTGISHELNRLSYVSALSHLRRVTTPPKLHRSVAARQMHNTNWGMICPNETPEGEPVGLVQNFALSACVTVGCSSEPVMKYLEAHKLIKLAHCTKDTFERTCKVFVNGQWIGVHENPMTIINDLRNLRRNGKLHSEVSISYLDGLKPAVVEIRTDAGRIYRPLLRVEGSQLKLTKEMIEDLINPNSDYKWEHLLVEGVVEELDTAEIMNSRVAMWQSDLLKYDSIPYTHCEIQPSLILGLGASTIPFANHNQAPRNTYQSGMAKQAVGLYATNFQFRSDLLAHVMHYPHKPLMNTAGAEYSKMCQLPAGQECIVAILTNGGYNQEDSVVLNASSVDRGLLRSSVMQTYTDIETRVSARHEQDECFECPKKSEVRILKTDEYDHLDDDGLPGVGVKIFERQIVIGKTAQCGGIKRDMSTSAKLNTNGVVRDAFVTTNEDGQRVHKVVVQETRIPKVGDKIASRHGQKGVIGMVYRQEDMPFTKEGVVPDVILNPHAIPSRMTWGHLVEALAGKSMCAGKGNLKATVDATAFSQPLTPDSFAQWLTPAGYHKHGEEVLYDGATGKKMNSTVFMGVNFYQRLRHMVDDKLNIRNRGAVTQLEGQPKRGLTREGAQRYGEMERDCTIAHGSAGVLHERLFTVSDAAYYKMCNDCGNVVSLDPYVNDKLKDRPYFKCLLCDENNSRSDNLSTVALPKAAKLLYQELLAMNIAIRFKTTKDLLKKDTCVKVDLKMFKNFVEQSSDIKDESKSTIDSQREEQNKKCETHQELRDNQAKRK